MATVNLHTLPAELLLEIGERLWHKDRASLIRVSKSCHAVLTPTLYDHYGKNLALRWAADNGSLLVMKAALSQCDEGIEREFIISHPIFNDLEDISRPVYATLLARASYRGHLDVVKFLLDNGADQGVGSYRFCSCIELQSIFEGFEAHDAPNVPEWYPLHYAICR